MYSWMLESFSARGSFVQTPCGPRKSGMPDSVEIPAPVSTTTRAEASIQSRTALIMSVIAWTARVLLDRGADSLELREVQEIVSGIEHPHAGEALLASF